MKKEIYNNKILIYNEKEKENRNYNQLKIEFNYSTAKTIYLCIVIEGIEKKDNYAINDFIMFQDNFTLNITTTPTKRRSQQELNKQAEQLKDYNIILLINELLKTCTNSSKIQTLKEIQNYLINKGVEKNDK